MIQMWQRTLFVISLGIKCKHCFNVQKLTQLEEYDNRQNRNNSTFAFAIAFRLLFTSLFNCVFVISREILDLCYALIMIVCFLFCFGFALLIKGVMLCDLWVDCVRLEIERKGLREREAV